MTRPIRLPAILLAGLVCPSACAISADPEIAARVRAVSKAELMRHVTALCTIGPRPAGSAENTGKTLAYLETELRKWGYKPVREPFGSYVLHLKRAVNDKGVASWVGSRSAEVQHNLIVEKVGVGAADTVVELGAHYDTVSGSPGADDNATGVAAAIEVARLVAERPTGKTIRIVFFAMEEDGLVGSREHVRRLVNEKRPPEGMLSMDMIGYASGAPDSQRVPVRIPLLFSPPTVGNFTLVAGNFSSGWLGELFEECADAYVPSLSYYSVNRLAGWFPDAARGDHWNYWRAGIASAALVDGMNYRNPNYHGRGDEPATLDQEFFYRNTQAVLATMLVWAGGPEH